MKRLVFLGIAAMNVSIGARAESGYTEKLKEESGRLIAKIKLVGKDLYSAVLPKKDMQKNENKGAVTMAYGASQHAEPVILESCDHCKDLCTKDQSAERFA